MLLDDTGKIPAVDGTQITGVVRKAGDTMTGQLNIGYASPIITMAKSGSGQANDIYGYSGGNNRWIMSIGDIAAESGGNAGSDFAIQRFNDAGALIDIAFKIVRSTGEHQIRGTNTNNNAPAGCVGEYLSASSSIGLSSATNANAAAISLTAGDWDVWGVVNFTGNASTTITYSRCAISIVSGSVDGTICQDLYLAGVAYFGSINGAGYNIQAPMRRISLAATTTVYLTVISNFAASTQNANGIIYARRRR
jgi:hypothetical protein